MPSFSLANRHDIVQVSANVEPAHARESLRVEYSHFKIDLGYLEPLIDELCGIGLLGNELLGRRFDAKDGAFLKLHEILILLHQFGALLLHKLLHLLLVHIFNLNAFEASSRVESGRHGGLIGVNCKISVAQVDALIDHLLMLLLLLNVERVVIKLAEVRLSFIAPTEGHREVRR